VRHERALAQYAQLAAQRLGGGDDQRLHLGLCLGAGGDRAAPGDPQDAQRFDPTGAALRDAGSAAGLSGPGGGFGVDRVGLALPAAGLAVGPVDLDHLDAGHPQVQRQPRAVGPGALDPDLVQLTMRTQPRQQPGIAGRGGRELPMTQQPAGRVEDRGGVGVVVRIDPTGHPTDLHHRPRSELGLRLGLGPGPGPGLGLGLGLGLLGVGLGCGVCHRGHDRPELSIGQGGTHQPGERTRQ